MLAQEDEAFRVSGVEAHAERAQGGGARGADGAVQLERASVGRARGRDREELQPRKDAGSGVNPLTRLVPGKRPLAVRAEAAGAEQTFGGGSATRLAGSGRALARKQVKLACAAHSGRQGGRQRQRRSSSQDGGCRGGPLIRGGASGWSLSPAHPPPGSQQGPQL